jgi:outer membrane protein
LKVKISSLAYTLALAALVAAPAAFGQASAPPPSGSPATASGKVAVLNFQQALAMTAEGKAASAQMQSQFAPAQAELDRLSSQIQDIEKRLQQGERTLSDEEKAKLQRQHELLTRTAQRHQEEFQEQAQAATADITDALGRKLVDVTDRYARENGYVAVLNSGQQGSSLIYTSPQIDITAEVVKLYDQAYPVKAAAPVAPKQTPPAAPKKQGAQQ